MCQLARQPRQEQGSHAKNLQRLTSLALGVLFPFSIALAEVREVSGEFLFGPDTSVSVACQAAEQKAKQEAIRQVLGEHFSVSEQLSCREGRSGTDSTDCVYNTFQWSEVDGDIREALLLGEPELQKQLGATKCLVRMRVAVDVPLVQPDPSFDFEAVLNDIRFRAKESVAFSILPSADMHIAVFSWAPSHDRMNIFRVFPNDFDKSGLMKGQQRNAIPTAANANRYGFQVTFPDKVEKDFVDEYLIFVATKRPISWLSQYDFNRFKSRLREISPSEKRVVKRSYRVIR